MESPHKTWKPNMCVRVRVRVCVCVIERERWRGKKGTEWLTDGVKRDWAKGSEGWDWVKEEWKWRGRARESKGRRAAACICVGSVSHAWLLHTTLLLIVCALIWVHLTCGTFFLSFLLRIDMHWHAKRYVAWFTPMLSQKSSSDLHKQVRSLSFDHITYCHSFLKPVAQWLYTNLW